MGICCCGIAIFIAGVITVVIVISIIIKISSSIMVVQFPKSVAVHCKLGLHIVCQDNIFLVGNFLSPLGLEPGTSHKSFRTLYHLR